VSEAEVENTRLSSPRVPEYIVVLVTYDFRNLASAPKVRWRARAGAIALGQGPKLLPELAHTTTSGLGGVGKEEGRELEGGALYNREK
jgi:hypothetical protein